MTDIIERLTQLAEHAVARIKFSSVLNPTLWIAGITTPASLYAVSSTTGPVQIAVLTLAFIPMAVFVFGFLYFAITNPDKLRSEDYEIKKMALELIEEKGSKIPILGTSIVAITNPDYKELPSPQGGEEE